MPVYIAIEIRMPGPAWIDAPEAEDFGSFLDRLIGPFLPEGCDMTGEVRHYPRIFDEDESED